MKDLIKLAFGTGYVKNYIESPNQTLINNELAKNKASYKVASDKLTQFLDIAGNIAVQQGLSQIEDSKDLLKSSMIFAGGGIVPNVPVEVEGGETVTTPEGLTTMLKGASHEQGGIDALLPKGSEVFSKRIKIDDKTLAQREKERTKQEEKLYKLLGLNKTDVLTKNAYERTKKNNEKDKNRDLQLQELLKIYINPKATGKQKLGGGSSNVGGKPDWIYKGFDYNYLKKLQENGSLDWLGDLNDEKTRKNVQALLYNHQLTSGKIDKDIWSKGLDKAIDGKFGPKTFQWLRDYNKDVGFSAPTVTELIGNNKDKKRITEPQSIPLLGYATVPLATKEDNFKSKKTLKEYEQEQLPKSLPKNLAGDVDLNDTEDTETNKKTGYIPSYGDMISLFGDLYSSTQLMKNTLENRAGDTPNINAFEHYGEKGLKTLDKSKGFLDDSKYANLLELLSSENNMFNKNHNSARGINTLRALDLTVDNASNNQKRKIENDYSAKLAQLLGIQSQMENEQDKMQMYGEQARDAADRQDRDAFYSQMATNIAGKGEGIQHIGKDVNAMQQNQMIMNLLNQISKYGLAIDNQGNIVKK